MNIEAAGGVTEDHYWQDYITGEWYEWVTEETDSVNQVWSGDYWTEDENTESVNQIDWNKSWRDEFWSMWTDAVNWVSDDGTDYYTTDTSKLPETIGSMTWQVQATSPHEGTVETVKHYGWSNHNSDWSTGDAYDWYQYPTTQNWNSGSWTEPATAMSYYNCRGKSKLINTVSKPESQQMTAIPGTGLTLNLNFKTPANLDCWDDSDEQDWIMNDSGACTSVCPLDYATEYPLRTTDGTVPTLANCNGGTIQIHGRRTVNYKLGNGMVLKADFWVTDVRTPIVGTTDLTTASASSSFFQ